MSGNNQHRQSVYSASRLDSNKCTSENHQYCQHKWTKFELLWQKYKVLAFTSLSVRFHGRRQQALNLYVLQQQVVYPRRTQSNLRGKLGPFGNDQRKDSLAVTADVVRSLTASTARQEAAVLILKVASRFPKTPKSCIEKYFYLEFLKTFWSDWYYYLLLFNFFVPFYVTLVLTLRASLLLFICPV